MAITASQVISAALGNVNAIDAYVTAVPAIEAAATLYDLNLMLGEWGADDELKFQVTDSVTASAASASYTLSGTWAVARPVRINRARATVNGFDSNVRVISRDEYSNLSDKTRTGPPECLFYDGGYPTGTVKLYPVPDAEYAMQIDSTKQFTPFSSTTSTADYSEEVTVAMVWNLSLRLIPKYPPGNPVIVSMAKNSLSKLRFSHLEDTAIQNVNPHSLIV